MFNSRLASVCSFVVIGHLLNSSTLHFRRRVMNGCQL